MRFKNKRKIKYGRTLIALLLICGLLFPLGQAATAATVSYQYDWITDTKDLPTDKQWHDYFIAWEDFDDKSKVWFTDYNWYLSSGDSNIDIGGSSWLEYKAISTLKDTTAKRFTSDESLGHMQIKYVGTDRDNGNSPKYLIRLSKRTGGYEYLTRWNTVSSESEAEAFTFQLQSSGDVFHIFINIAAQADKYLTRDGDQLETSLSSSSSEDEYPMRVYKRTRIIGEEEQESQEEDFSKVQGKVTLYEYNWINSLEDLNGLTDDRDWHDIFLAWEQHNGEYNNRSNVWYTKEIWYDSDGPNYENEYHILEHDTYRYYSNDQLGTDGYSSATADKFVMPYAVGHFQLQFADAHDGDNHLDGVKNADGSKIKSPKFFIRMNTGNNIYAYLDDYLFENSKPDKDDALTFQMYLNESKKGSSGYYYGSGTLFDNTSAAYDPTMTRKGNMFYCSWGGVCDDWELPFRIYTREAAEYDAIVRSFTIGEGATYSVDKRLILKEGITITVENGGVLMVDNQLYNNGNIVVKDGGTVIVNEGGYIMPFGSTGSSGSIDVDGGDLLILDGGKVLLDEGSCALCITNGGTVLNRGLLVIANKLELRNNSLLQNAPSGVVLLGAKIGRERGSVGEHDFNSLIKRADNRNFSVLGSVKSKIINNGFIYEPSGKTVTWSWDGTSQMETGSSGQRLSH